MNNIPELFGCLVFNDKVMKERLPKEAYLSIRRAVEDGTALPDDTAGIVAEAMKEWAVEKGATHYTHWFQPMTGITAEKHDSFITPSGRGEIIMKFSGKELIKGEADASSFPSGGIRATFEARGYTAWDPSSYAFIKDGALCIPTAFMSYTGEVLDKKTPLLRSMSVLSQQAARVLKLFGKQTGVVTTVGAEQEYFLIDRETFNRRKDLILTGRTLFGARPPKGQELEDHYFGNIKPRIISFMQDLDRELWMYGIYAKTRHNEAAPAQHELAPVFASVNIASDHNQLTMEIMKKVAEKHSLYCLLHEKPFAGVNGSGKHNNWSMSTTEGENLLDPGKDPENNLQFLLFISAVIEAVDKHQDLLRLSVATAGNDHRLGGNEAPPAIVSMFLGDELTAVLSSIADEKPYSKKSGVKFSTGVQSIPSFMQDTTDRNRTSPFAFTGNKLEFRMLGSAVNISCPNVMINTAVAESLCDMADTLEKSGNFRADALKYIRGIYKRHKRIVFNGNNYSEDWTAEAQRRGLLNLSSTPQALKRYDSDENVALFDRFRIYTKAEIQARQEILLENYSKVLNIEALTMIDMTGKQILPAAIKYGNLLAETLQRKQAVNINPSAERRLLGRISALTDGAYAALTSLTEAVTSAKAVTDAGQSADYYHDTVLPRMDELRKYCDELEMLVDRECWPFPTYSDILFY